MGVKEETYLSSLELPGIITNGMCPVLGHRFFDGIGRSEAQRINIWEEETKCILQRFEAPWF